MQRSLPYLIVIAVAAMTLASATILFRVKRVPAPAMMRIQPSPSKSERTAEGPHIEKAEPIHIRGNPKAAVTIEEFGDFQCPPCGGLSDVLKQIEKDYGDHLRVIFNHFPLIAHQHARQAALAAEAAAMQNRFWEMHDLLYREQSVWSKAADVHDLFSAYAGMLGLNIDQFNKDMESEAAKQRVESDQRRGVSLGVSSTPTIFVNDTALPPASLNAAGLRAGIDQAMNANLSRGN